jgi:hypothetical protein
MFIRKTTFVWLGILFLSGVYFISQGGCGTAPDNDIDYGAKGTSEVSSGGYRAHYTWEECDIDFDDGSVPDDSSDGNGNGYGRDGHPLHKAPVIESVVPARVYIDGGVEITLKGEGFARMPGKEPTVMLGDVKIEKFKVRKRGTELRFTVPAVDRPQTIEVKVINKYGEGSHKFVYFSGVMTLTGIQPSKGTTCGGTPVTISGTHFTYTEDTKVCVGGRSLNDLDVVSKNEIRGTVPPGVSEGVVDVTVACSNAEVPLSLDFTYREIEAYDILPAAGTICGGTEVTIYGAGFNKDWPPFITIGGEPLRDPVIVSSTTITGITPPLMSSNEPQTVDVIVAGCTKADTLPFEYTKFEFKGYIPEGDEDYGLKDFNPAVIDVKNAINELHKLKDTDGTTATYFRVDTKGFPAPGGFCFGIEPAAHWQSIQYLYPPNDRYLLLVSSDERYSNSEIFVVDTWLSPPAIIGKAPQDGLPDYDHFGGMQVVGGYVAVAVEHSGSPHDPKVIFYDATFDSHSNVELTLLPTRIDVDNPNHGSDWPGLKSSAVGITKLRDGKFLVAVLRKVGAYDRKTNTHADTIISFFISTSKDLRHTQFVLYDDWNENDSNAFVPGHDDFPNCGFQNINLVVNEPTGSIWLIGMATGLGSAAWICGDGVGGDEAWLYNLWMTSDQCEKPEIQFRFWYNPKVRQRSRSEIYCNYDCDIYGNCGLGSDMCKPNFDAGAGIRIGGDDPYTKRDQIWLYATEHFTSCEGGGRNMAQISWWRRGNKN